MEKNRILVSIGEGIGNICQALPLIWSLKKNYTDKVDVWIDSNYPEIEPLIEILTDSKVYTKNSQINQSLYKFRIETIWTFVVRHRLHSPNKQNIPIINDQTSQRFIQRPITRGGYDIVIYEYDEVFIFIQALSSLKDYEGVYVYDYKNFIGNNNYIEILKNKIKPLLSEKFLEIYDLYLKHKEYICFHNGYNWKAKQTWERKAYNHFPEVVKLLQNKNNITCVSIGTKNEYIDGTINFTGFNFLESAYLILNALFHVCNDTGTFHLANALGQDNIVLFGATSIEKNVNKHFHRFAKIIRKPLNCSPCQTTNRWHNCRNWKCMNFDPHYIYNKIIDAYSDKLVDLCLI